MLLFDRKNQNEQKFIWIFIFKCLVLSMMLFFSRKYHKKTIFFFQVEKPVRKSAGLLLETAGKSLLQRRMPPAATAADRKFNSLLGLGGASSGANSNQPAQLSFGLAPEKISFGLYDGNLAVEAASGKGISRIYSNLVKRRIFVRLS